MAHAHDRTLLAKLGFADPDKKDARHDLACRYTALPESGLAIAKAEDARDAARADARVLAHAYRNDTRPPPDVVERALLYPEKEET